MDRQANELYRKLDHWLETRLFCGRRNTVLTKIKREACFPTHHWYIPLDRV